MYLTAMLNHVFISFSAVQMYDLSNIHLQQEDSSEEWHTTSPNEIHFIPRDHAIRKQRLFTL